MTDLGRKIFFVSAFPTSVCLYRIYHGRTLKITLLFPSDFLHLPPQVTAIHSLIPTFVLSKRLPTPIISLSLPTLKKVTSLTRISLYTAKLLINPIINTKLTIFNTFKYSANYLKRLHLFNCLDFYTNFFDFSCKITKTNKYIYQGGSSHASLLDKNKILVDVSLSEDEVTTIPKHISLSQGHVLLKCSWSWRSTASYILWLSTILVHL